jgi:protein SCO1/2
MRSAACLAAVLCFAAAAWGEDPHEGHGHDVLPGTEPLAEESIYQLEGSWIAAGGRTLALADLRGKPVVMLLFYGTCQSVCPILVRDVQRIEEALSEQDVDRPDRLAAYAEEHGLSGGRWILLHGGSEQVRELAAVLGVRYRRTSGGQYAHSQRISLLDREGRVAAQYDGLERPLGPIVERLRQELAVPPR